MASPNLEIIHTPLPDDDDAFLDEPIEGYTAQFVETTIEIMCMALRASNHPISSEAHTAVIELLKGNPLPDYIRNISVSYLALAADRISADGSEDDVRPECTPRLTAELIRAMKACFETDGPESAWQHYKHSPYF